MKKNIIVFLVFLLFISLWINIYLINLWNRKIFNKTVENKKITSYKIIRNKWINLYKILYTKFEHVHSKESFLKFKKSPGGIIFLFSLQKKQDIIMWDKYLSFVYKYENFNKKYKTFREFKQYALRYFNPWEWKNLSRLKNITSDLDIVFSSIKLSKSLELCNMFFHNKEDILSCRDQVYFYRSTEKKLYCSKITDTYKEKLCFDYFLYSNKKFNEGR